MIKCPNNYTRYDGRTQSAIEADKLCELIENTITERYSVVEKLEDPRGKEGPCCIPLDTVAIHQLFNKLTVDFFAVQLSTMCTTQPNGQNACCEEDLARERQQHLSRPDYDIKCAGQQLDGLNDEHDQLLRTPCRR